VGVQQDRWEGSGTAPAHGVELGFGDSESVRCQSAWSARAWWARCRPDVAESAVAYYALDCGRVSKVQEFREQAVDC
jgi:hypothetical protein